jgi:protein required for attachment to host cells
MLLSVCHSPQQARRPAPAGTTESEQAGSGSIPAAHLRSKGVTGEHIMKNTWIVSADSSRARIFEVQGKEHHLHEIADLVNPEGRASGRDLRSDAEGRYFGPGRHAQGHSAGEASAVGHANEIFSREVGQYLDKARTQHQFERLVLVAPPRFLGLLRRALSDEVRNLVVEEMDKNLSWLDTRDIERHLKQ